MSEESVVKRTPFPVTTRSLVQNLRKIGMAEGQTVLVHMAMSKLGWVAGGGQAVIEAFLEVLGDSGTLMMPSHSTENTDPAKWQNPPVPESWWQVIRDERSPYDPERTPTRQLGVVAELFRRYPNVIRSNHPATSFTAHGKHARFLTDDHRLEDDLGNHSPLGRLYDLDGYVLLLGVNHGNNTSLHLAEYRANYRGKRTTTSGSAMLINGKRQWVSYETVETNDDDFAEIGNAFDTAINLPVPKIGDAECRFFKQRLAVDFAVTWMEQNRNSAPSETTNT